MRKTYIPKAFWFKYCVFHVNEIISIINQTYKYTMPRRKKELHTSVGRYGHFHIVISPTCEIADTRYYRAWVGGGKRETLCHKLFHNYLVILNRACVCERERARAWTYQ